MSTQNIQPNSFKATIIIYYGLFAGQALMGLIFYYLMQSEGREDTLESPFNIIIPGAVAFGIIASYLVGQYQKNNLPPAGSSADEKLEHFRRWSIVRFALLEGGNLVALVLAFMFGSINYMLCFVVGLAAFILLRPVKDRFVQDYQVSRSEAEGL
ncbi:MAG TPA: hypothetical protein ENJ95_16980 [Bacteroidetes bacterium]|nr:hypothetical protein [Bacteroidota bacterium]